VDAALLERECGEALARSGLQAAVAFEPADTRGAGRLAARRAAAALPAGSADGRATVTISHAGGVAGAVAALRAGIGLDVEPIRPIDPALLGVAFTAAERAAILEADEQLTCILRIWTAKEAVLKALRVGLRWPPGKVEVELAEGRASAGGAVFRLLPVVTSRHVATIAVGSG
jgi:phosphopantetheinyl transferase